MHAILVLGAGKIGSAICDLLAHCGDYSVTLADNNPAGLAAVAPHPNLKTRLVDVGNPEDIAAALAGQFAVISACPYQFTTAIATAAAKAQVHYFDLTEDVASTKAVTALAADATRVFMPQSGLAPGFVSIVANHLARDFDELRDLQLRVGALPMYPNNALKYNLTWSTDGLINEYCQPCEAVVAGKLMQVPPLEELESFSLDGTTYEAFNTSGGLGTLCESWAGKVQNLNYRSVRYPGHRDLMKMLLQDLRFKDRQPLLKEVLESALPSTSQDVVLLFVTANGFKQGRFVQECYANKIYNQNINGRHWSAIQVVTATSVCALIDLLVAKKLPQAGFVRQEQVNFNDFISNRFGRFYLGASANAAGEVKQGHDHAGKHGDFTTKVA